MYDKLQKELLISLKEDSDGGYYLGVITPVHQAVHEGKMHTISFTKLLVDDEGTLLVRIAAGLTKDVHTRIAFTGEGKTTLKSFLNSTYSDDGTLKEPFNRVTGIAENIEADVYIDPVVSVAGTPRGNDFVGAGGAIPTRVGGTGSADIETIVSAGDDLLFEITNLRGSASDLNIIINMYERDKAL